MEENRDLTWFALSLTFLEYLGYSERWVLRFVQHHCAVKLFSSMKWLCFGCSLRLCERVSEEENGFFFHRHYLLLLFFYSHPHACVNCHIFVFSILYFFLLFISHFTSWTNQITCFLIYFGSGYNDVFMHTNGTGGKILIIYKWSGGGGHWANHNEPLCCCFHSKASIIMNVLLQIYIYIYISSLLSGMYSSFAQSVLFLLICFL